MNEGFHEGGSVNNWEYTENSVRENLLGLATNMDEVNVLSVMSSRFRGLNPPMKSMKSDSPKIVSVSGGEETAKIICQSVPEIATNIKVVDSLIAEQMMKLPVEEREQAYMDLHAAKKGLQKPRTLSSLDFIL